MRHHLLALVVVPTLLLIAGLAAAGAVNAGGGCHGGTGIPSASEGNVVKIDGCTFLPTITSVGVGEEVRFINSGVVPHDVTGRESQWASPTLAAGADYTHRFLAAGLYPYSCSLHPGMAGVVIVGQPAVAAKLDLRPAAAQVPAVPAQAAPTAATAESGSAIPVIVASGAGMIVGLVGAGLLLRRRDAAE